MLHEGEPNPKPSDRIFGDHRGFRSQPPRPAQADTKRNGRAWNQPRRRGGGLRQNATHAQHANSHSKSNNTTKPKQKERLKWRLMWASQAPV
jgi:hypothetical protein